MRRVIYVERFYTYPNNAQWFRLKLECGHFKDVRKRKLTLSQALRSRRPFHPERAKCEVCV